jgi:beta-lactam-binding protein with PASTA domain
MPGPFTITTASNSTQLNADRRGEASFTIFNATGHPIRGQARLRAEDPTAAPWLSLKEEAEQDFDVDDTQQVTVQIAVPPDAPPGRYAFRLDMVGVENPDEFFSAGPGVNFEVPEPEPERKPFPWWIAAVAGVLVVGGIIAAVLLWPRSVVVPTVAESTITEATEALEAIKLKVSSEPREAFSDDIARSLVINTDPPAGQEVRQGTRMTLIVSDGPEPVRLPDVYDRTRADARDILTDACARDPCVEVVVQLEPSRTVDRGRVIATDPEKDSVVPQGSDVTLIVSSGLPTVRVPDLTGATIEQAEAELTAVELQVSGTNTEKSVEIPKDQVIRTDPSAGTEVEIDTSVALVVSSGRPIAVRHLIRMERGNPVGDLITHWDGLGTGFYWTLHLDRGNVELADGRRWNADTAYEILMNNENLNNNLWSVNQIDNYTLRVTPLSIWKNMTLLEDLAQISIKVYTTE